MLGCEAIVVAANVAVHTCAELGDSVHIIVQTMLGWFAVGWPMFVDPACRYAGCETHAGDGQDVELPDEPTPKVLGRPVLSSLVLGGAELFDCADLAVGCAYLALGDIGFCDDHAATDVSLATRVGC